MNKIILLDHAQDFTSDPISAEMLRDVDIIVSAGSTGFLAMDEPIGPFNSLREGDSGTGAYPTIREDMDMNPVLVVNSDQLYRYIGNLIVGFDESGIIDFVDSRSGPIGSDASSVEALGNYVGVDPLEASQEVQDLWAERPQSDGGRIDGVFVLRMRDSFVLKRPLDLGLRENICKGQWAFVS